MLTNRQPVSATAARRWKAESAGGSACNARPRVGQRDRSVDPYSGREHPQFGPGGPFERLAPNGPALEVIAHAMQTTFYPLYGYREFLPALVHKDPEVLDLTLGLLFRYDPP